MKDVAELAAEQGLELGANLNLNNRSDLTKLLQ